MFARLGIATSVLLVLPCLPVFAEIAAPRIIGSPSAKKGRHISAQSRNRSRDAQPDIGA